MSGYSGLSIGTHEKKVTISQANPVQLSSILLNLRYKAYSELSNTIYTYQSDYQYQYKYYLAKLSRYESLEHSVTIQLCSMYPEARQRINLGSTLVLQNYSDEEIYYSQYPIPHNIFMEEVQVFREFTFFLSLRRSLLELRKKIWRLYSIIETKNSVLKLWESEYHEAIRVKAENEYIYNLTNDFGRSVKDYAEKLKQKRFSESRKVKEMTVLNHLEGGNSEELEKVYSDSENDRAERRSCFSVLPINRRRVSLHCSVRSESPNSQYRARAPGEGGAVANEADSVLPGSKDIKKELNKLPPKPEAGGGLQ